MAPIEFKRPYRFSRQDGLLVQCDPVAKSAGGAGSRHSPCPENQTFSTCEKSSSTGVARPKMVTDTRTFDFS